MAASKQTISDIKKELRERELRRLAQFIPNTETTHVSENVDQVVTESEPEQTVLGSGAYTFAGVKNQVSQTRRRENHTLSEQMIGLLRLLNKDSDKSGVTVIMRPHKFRAIFNGQSFNLLTDADAGTFVNKYLSDIVVKTPKGYWYEPSWQTNNKSSGTAQNHCIPPSITNILRLLGKDQKFSGVKVYMSSKSCKVHYNEHKYVLTTEEEACEFLDMLNKLVKKTKRGYWYTPSWKSTNVSAVVERKLEQEDSTNVPEHERFQLPSYQRRREHWKQKQRQMRRKSYAMQQ